MWGDDFNYYDYSALKKVMFIYYNENISDSFDKIQGIVTNTSVFI